MNLPPDVFWGEIEEIKAVRNVRQGEKTTPDATQSPSGGVFDGATVAVAAVRVAEKRVKDAYDKVGRLADGRLRVAKGVSGLPLGDYVRRALDKASDRDAVEDVARAENQLLRVRAIAARDAHPSAPLGLVGVALSGGGIRSATFNLGALQVFAKHGLLDSIDYLSTVSGGGYIGGTVSSLLSERGASPSAPDFPLRHERGREESPAMKHLRHGASYLAPEGVLDKIRIPALVLRGLIINLLVLVPYVVMAVVASKLLWGVALVGAHPKDGPGMWTAGRITSGYKITLGLAALLILWAVLSPLIRHLGWLGWRGRNNMERSFALFFTCVGVAAILSMVPLAIFHYHKNRFVPEVITGGWVGTVLAIAAPLLPLLLASGAPRVLDTWRGRLMVYTLGLVGPILLLLLYLELSAWWIFKPELPIMKWLCLDPTTRMDCARWWTAIVTPVEYVLRSTTPASLPILDWAFLVTGGALLAYGVWAVDVNTTALHGFYRDRISQAYLFRAGAGDGAAVDGVHPADTLRLSELAPAGTRAPYHLINATLNVQAGHEASGRHADFFLFSKRFIGSTLTDYCETRAMERTDSRLNLGTAVAVSGAALAPNMGTVTNRALVFVMTLLNVRTGYWLPNPRDVKGSRGPFPGVGPIFLFRELFGFIDHRSSYVNVSDGGHIENIGLFELLRRRCKYIIVCDSEADSKLAFSGLAKVMQYARIDGSIEIDINLDRLRKDDRGRSGSHWALGTIRYSSEEQGRLLYLKASFTGNETEDIKAYHAQIPEFPHEPTGQQFFSEGQFEAYRALGYQIATEVIGDEQFDPARVGRIEEWFDVLAARQMSEMAPPSVRAT